MSDNPSSYDATAVARAFEESLGVAASEPVRSVGMPLAQGTSAITLSDATQQPEEVEQKRPVSEIADHIRRVFRANAAHRREAGIDERMEANKLILAGKYSEREKSEIAAATGLKNPIFLRYADQTHRVNAAKLAKIIGGTSERPWTLVPTPKADVPERVKQHAVELSMEQMGKLQQLAVQLVKSGSVPPDELQDLLPSPLATAARAPQLLDEARRTEQEKAEEACDRMAQLIWDQQVEGGFLDTCRDAIEHLTSQGTCVIAGPIPRMRRVPDRIEKKDGTQTIKMRDRLFMEFEAVSPWDCYPSPGARKMTDGEFIRRVRFQPFELAQFARAKEKEAKGWRRDAVDTILSAFPNGGCREQESTKWEEYQPQLDSESSQSLSRNSDIEGLEYYGNVRGSELLSIGITKDAGGRKLVSEDYYEVDCLTIMDLVVFCRVLEPEIGRPLFKCEFFRNVDSWWGEGPVDYCRDAQRGLNATARNIVVNMAQSSGPQAVIDPLQIPGNDITMRPGKAWLLSDKPNGMPNNRKPIEFFTVPSCLGDLLQVGSYFKTASQELSATPGFTYGQTDGLAAGVTRTASVMSILSEGSMQALEYVVRSWDVMIRSIVMWMYSWNLLHHDDESVKIGDVRCDPSGVLGYALVEQNYQKLISFMQLSGNPTDMQILGAKGRAYLLRKVAESLSINLDNVIPAPEKLEEIQKFNELKEKLAAAQQKANVESTQAGTEGVEARNAAEGAEEGGTPPAAPVEEPAEDTEATPSPAPGTNARRAQAAAARRIAGNGGDRNGLSPAARGTIAATLKNPQARALAARTAAANRGRAPQ